MTFKKWLEKREEAFHDSLLDHAKKQGLKMKDKHHVLVPEGLDERTTQLFNAYQNQRVTNRLVWATWFLALTTIVLSIVSLVIR